MTDPPSAYPSYAAIQARHIAARRAAALAAAREATAVAVRLDVRVRVFGSLAEGTVHRASDLDLALDRPDEAALFRAEGEVFDAVAGHGLPASIVRLDRAPPALRDRIPAHGRDPAELE